MKDEDIKKLRKEYDALHGLADQFREELVNQLRHLLAKLNIYLAIPIESRTKSWDSLEEKLERKTLSLKAIPDLQDLIGIRLVLLFARDVPTVCKTLEETFSVVSKEDTAQRLTDNQFGYASFHFIITIPSEWLTVPSLKELPPFNAEVQVRTAAQHIWAASSHVLQYKHESSVPAPLRRTINRISALLETVDLEFERVLSEKEFYIDNIEANGAEPLNVDALAKTLSEVWPNAHNFGDSEDYSGLLEDLDFFDITDTHLLRALVDKQKEAALKHDAQRIKKLLSPDNAEPIIDVEKQRIKRGAYYSYTGLTREALLLEFGDTYKAYLRERGRISKPKRTEAETD